MINAKNQNSDKVDVVLQNVDNPRWNDFIDKYEVNGIPKLVFFDARGELKGFSLGVRKYTELNEIFLSLINNLELPSFTKVSNSSKLSSNDLSTAKISNNLTKVEKPRIHG